ncbi:hypothetical protein DH2020_021108 [Rehmannia glutinosa]|uniref:Uncharacterized protein n=1 Tax=Rehmannia glutinosa TaxID=99300 RepID=A0ABR0WBQ6_REHGL
MAPKRRSGRSVKTVTTTKKVVEETVQVVVTPGAEDRVELLSSSTKENKNVEISTSSPHEEQHHITKTIPIHEENDDDEDETQPASEPETAPTPPRKERRRLSRRSRKPQYRRNPGRGNPENVAVKRRRAAVDGGGEGYKRYVFKVMKQVHPEMGISSKAMTVINNLMGIYSRGWRRRRRGCRNTHGGARCRRGGTRGGEAGAAGELGKHAIAEGTKAVTNYVSYVSGKKA